MSALRLVFALALATVAGCATSAGYAPVAATEEALTATCAEGPTTRGIDVSAWQGTVNWTQVAGSGVRFAFIRVSDGASHRDDQFARNWSEARRVGVLRGVYQFFRPGSDVAAQARLVIDAIASDPGELAPVIDVEASDGRSPSQVAAAVRRWVELVQAGTGRTPIVYTGPYFWRDEAGNPDLGTHPLWIAHYTSRCPLIPEDIWSRWTFWQYSSSGRVPGISGNVDMDHFNGTYEQLLAFAGGAAPMPAPMPAPAPTPSRGSGTLAWPVDSPPVTSPVTHTSRGRLVDHACTAISRANHKGTDFGVARRTPVHAAADGTVVRAVDGCGEGSTSCGGGFGNHVIVLHTGGRATLYAHLTSGSVAVRAGARVTCGQQVGLSGNTGHSTGPHLHFEVRDGVSGSGEGAVGSYYSRPPTDPFGGACSTQAADLWGDACAPAGPRDDSRYVSAAHPREVTVAPGEELRQTWRLENSGTTTWSNDAGYALVHVDGPSLDGLERIGLGGEGRLAPRENTLFDVVVRAPTAGGTYTSTYQMTHGDVRFGTRVTVTLRVAAPRACSSMTLGRDVVSGSCVQVSYSACGMSSCAWFRCADGEWTCTEPSACTGESFSSDACAPPPPPAPSCDGLDCGTCTTTPGCGFCGDRCVAAGDTAACGGEMPTTDPGVCTSCYDVGFACAAATQCCGFRVGGSIDCVDGFCEDTSMCQGLGDTCVDGDPNARCCGTAICSPDEGGTELCCQRPGDRCDSDADCCGYMACDGGHCRAQAVGEQCASSQECEGASYCTSSNVCGFAG